MTTVNPSKISALFIKASNLNENYTCMSSQLTHVRINSLRVGSRIVIREFIGHGKAQRRVVMIRCDERTSAGARLLFGKLLNNGFYANIFFS